ncbi:MAG: transcription antitermination factor NusB [Terracidiphilus sp.]
MPAISPSRKAAFRILLAIERGKACSDDLLHGEALNLLAPADCNLATALVLGVLRWQIVLDEQVKGLLKRPGAKLEREVRIALRLGAFQLLFLDRIPPHAAIDESVELAKQSGHRFASGMVNAVLRKLSAEASNRRTALASPDVPAQAYPTWLVERWEKSYGPRAAHAICCHGQTQPSLTLHLDDPSADAELLEAGILLEPGRLLSAARIAVAGDVTPTAAFREGRVRVQDEGSQLIAELAACADGNCGQTPKTILDTCAAPGGKTMILASRHPDAKILACESSPRRLAELRKRLAVYGDRLECRLADASELKQESSFDLALADVPCSGTGTLGRNPEIRLRLRLDDLARHAERQRAILAAALRCVRPGGRIVYSTCSIEPEENEQVVAAALAQNQNARQLSLSPNISSLELEGRLIPSAAEQLRNFLTPEGALQLLPGIAPTDGFFAALFQRTE